MRQPAAPKPQISDLASFIAAAELGSDAAFTEVLTGEKQRLDHTAPKALRDLITSVDILRMSASQGIAHADGVAELVWYFNELGIAGSEDEVLAAVTDSLTRAGFVQVPAAKHWNLVFQREDDQLNHEVSLEGPHGWTGGKREAAGVRLLWRVTSKDSLPTPTFAEASAALPFLVDDRIDASIYEALADLPVTSVTSGGTWTRYYSLSASFTSSEEGLAKELLAKVGSALEAAGFTLSSKSSADKLRLERPATGSHAQLSLLGQRVSLHIQPES